MRVDDALQKTACWAARLLVVFAFHVASIVALEKRVTQRRVS
jgi:hypothetical protein